MTHSSKGLRRKGMEEYLLALLFLFNNGFSRGPILIHI